MVFDQFGLKILLCRCVIRIYLSGEMVLQWITLTDAYHTWTGPSWRQYPLFDVLMKKNVCVCVCVSMLHPPSQCRISEPPELILHFACWRVPFVKHISFFLFFIKLLKPSSQGRQSTWFKRKGLEGKQILFEPTLELPLELWHAQ